eukprot:690183-Prymnesium_polylepis.1
MSWTWGGRAVRVAALMGEQTQWHDAGWWGGAGWTVGDRHPRLWCAWGMLRKSVVTFQQFPVVTGGYRAK